MVLYNWKQDAFDYFVVPYFELETAQSGLEYRSLKTAGLVVKPANTLTVQIIHSKGKLQYESFEPCAYFCESLKMTVNHLMYVYDNNMHFKHLGMLNPFSL